MDAVITAIPLYALITALLYLNNIYLGNLLRQILHVITRFKNFTHYFTQLRGFNVIKLKIVLDIDKIRSNHR